MQSPESGRTASQFGKKIAQVVASWLKVELSPESLSNEIQIDGKRAVIKTAGYKTIYVGITKAMFPRLDRGYAALEDAKGNFDLFLLDRDFLNRYKIPPAGYSAETQWFFRRSDIRKHAHNLGNIPIPRTRYWVTTHWPPRVDRDRDAMPSGVHLPHDRFQEGRKIAPGDLVAIYESRTGRDLVVEDTHGAKHTLQSHPGREGVVTIVQVVTELYSEPESEPEEYAGGTSIWWKWHADTKPYLSSGFVPQEELNRILGYKPAYNFRGFGDEHSGLKEVDEHQFSAILAAFKKNREKSEVGQLLAKSKSLPQGGGGCAGGESDAHRRLKDAVAANPSALLNEPGLKLIRKEYPFASGDRADIMLEDAQGRVVGLEVEVAVDLSNLAGVLQAIKYRFMGALTEGVKFVDTRSILVAHKISKDVRTLCANYEIDCFEIPETVMR